MGIKIKGFSEHIQSNEDFKFNQPGERSVAKSVNKQGVDYSGPIPADSQDMTRLTEEIRMEILDPANFLPESKRSVEDLNCTQGRILSSLKSVSGDDGDFSEPIVPDASDLQDVSRRAEVARIKRFTDEDLLPRDLLTESKGGLVFISPISIPSEVEPSPVNDLSLTTTMKVGQNKRKDAVVLGELSPVLEREKSSINLEAVRVAATDATKNGDSIQPLLDFQFPPEIKELLNEELSNFKKRASDIQEFLANLPEEGRKKINDSCKVKIMESLYKMSDTCSGPSHQTDRGRLAKSNFLTCFEALNDGQWRESFYQKSTRGIQGKEHPLYGGPETRFLEFNKMLNLGEGGKGKIEPIKHGEPRSQGEEACIRHMVESGPNNVDGAVHAIPGGSSCIKNVKAISTFIKNARAKIIRGSNDEVLNPIEVLGKAYQAEITNHTCSNGNGRSAVLNLMASALDLGVPMPLMSKSGTKMIHAMYEQIEGEENMSPLDAAMAVAQGMHRMLSLQEEMIREFLSFNPVTQEIENIDPK